MDILVWWVLLPRPGLKGSSVGGDGSPLDDDPENGVTLWCFREKIEDLPLEDVRGALLDMMKGQSSGDGDERDGESSG